MMLRPTLNLLLATALVVGGVLLLRQEAFFLRDRWEPAVGTLFAGWSLRFLAGTLFGLAAFAGAIAFGWLRGTFRQPAGRTWVHPAYKGQLLLRYWYLIVLALGCLGVAFALADRHVPNPHLTPAVSTPMTGGEASTGSQ